MTKKLTNAQRDELIEQYVEIVVDNLDHQDLIQYATDNITDYVDSLSDSELKEEINNRDDELYEELVDNVTQQYPKQDPANNPTFHMDQAFANLDKEDI